jgi:hypothetical protein
MILRSSHVGLRNFPAGCKLTNQHAFAAKREVKRNRDLKYQSVIDPEIVYHSPAGRNDRISQVDIGGATVGVLDIATCT